MGARPVEDVVANGLDVLFCGINPGMRSAESGHHFAHRSNRFWRVLYESGFTDRLLAPEDDAGLVDRGLGIVNLVRRPSASASELSALELRAGAEALMGTVRRLEPRAVAVLGLQAYRVAFRAPRAPLGRQSELIGSSEVWVFPNPSGLQARYPVSELVSMFAELRAALGYRAAP